MPIPVPTVALYGAVNAIINVGLAANVSRNRGKANIMLGTGDSPELLRAARAHGNNAEYVALALLMLLIAELSGGGSTILHVFGGVLTLSRVIHAHGILSDAQGTRVGGIMLTWLTIVGLAVYTLVLRYGS